MVLNMKSITPGLATKSVFRAAPFGRRKCVQVHVRGILEQDFVVLGLRALGLHEGNEASRQDLRVVLFVGEDPIAELVPEYQYPGIGIVHDVLDLPGLHPVPDHDQANLEVLERVGDLCMDRVVVGHQGDLVSGSHAQAIKAPGQGPGPLPELSVGKRPVRADDGPLLRMIVCMNLQEVRGLGSRLFVGHVFLLRGLSSAASSRV
jgi:hypothetical protein